MKEEKENHKPPHIDKGDRGADKQVEPENGTTWRDL